MESSYTIVVSDPELLSQLCGINDSNLQLIEEHLGVSIFLRGNELSIFDAGAEICDRFKLLLERVINELSADCSNPKAVIQSVIKDFADSDQNDGTGIPSLAKNFIQIPGAFQRVYPKTAQQAAFIVNMRKYDMVFCSGPAGSGKTFLAVAEALSLLLSRKKRKLVLTRPVVEAGESLGFLPGDLEQKINPYLRPLYDAMDSLLPRDVLRRMDENGMIEIAPLAYMRGRTLNDSVIILDEAQNTTTEQMKMFLTRMGEGSKVFITGDITQIDLPKRVTSGLVQATEILSSVDDICVMQMHADDVVRNPLVKKIIRAYQNAEEF
ncbi:MAG: PhoH family protein [Spirochaetaceae bacterium]|nr:PhoH family protein [Spirochaetaceae bacterium]